ATLARRADLERLSERRAHHAAAERKKISNCTVETEATADCALGVKMRLLLYRGRSGMRKEVSANAQRIVDDGFRRLGFQGDVTPLALVPEIPSVLQPPQDPDQPKVKIILSDSTR